MLEKQIWKGQYSFLNKRINEVRGFEKTGFEIEVLSVNGNAFTGKIQDDITTGGMEGIGDVNGHINGDNIEFVKLMPKMVVLVNQKGTKKTYNKKHRPIYYSGKLSNDGKSAAGTWRFKLGFSFLGFRPFIFMPTKGTWSMELTSI